VVSDELPVHIGWLLWEASHAWTRRFAAALRHQGFGDVTLGQVNLLGHLDRARGVRQNDIADRSGLTKQAVGQFVTELERAGLVERVPDPEDRRARLVGYTPRGLLLLAEGDAIKAEFEAEYAALLGTADFSHLKKILDRLVEGVQQEETGKLR
jgi:DNA-binding MarR family transcriptional regulator